MDWTADPWSPEPRTDDQMLHGQLPPNPLQEFKGVYFPELTIDSDDSTFLEVLAKLESLQKRGEELKNKLSHDSNVSRTIIANLNAALRNARQYLDLNDNNYRIHSDRMRMVADEDKRVRALYQDRKLRQAEMDSLLTELNAYEAIARDKPWGEKMKPHQRLGAYQMAFERRCINSDDMGLGKTLQAIIAMDLAGENAMRVVVFAPNPVISNFAREINYWSPDRNVVAIGDVKNKAMRHTMLKMLKDEPEFTVLINYESWRRDPELLKILIDLKFQVAIMDEAHNLKDPDSIATKGVMRVLNAENLPFICKHCSYEFTRWPNMGYCGNCRRNLKREPYARQSIKRVYPLTGTPILNSPGEIFPLLHMLDYEAFHDKTEFLRRYCQQIEVPSLTGGSYVKKWVFGPGGQDMLMRKMGTKLIRRTRGDEGIEIPPQGKTIHTLEFEENEYLEQRKVMEGIRHYAQIMMSNEEVLTLNHMVVLITRLRQAVTMPSGIKLRNPENPKEIIGTCDVRQSIKVDYAERLVQELVQVNGQRVVVFSQFNEPLDELAARLEKLNISAARFSTERTPQEKDEIGRDFDTKYTRPEESKYQVFLSTFKMGGTGINLNGATEVVVIDEEWNPGQNNQAYARTNRLDSESESMVHILRVKNTIDEGMARINEFKQDISDGFDAHARANIKAMLKELLDGNDE